MDCEKKEIWLNIPGGLRQTKVNNPRCHVEMTEQSSDTVYRMRNCIRSSVSRASIRIGCFVVRQGEVTTVVRLTWSTRPSSFMGFVT